MRRRITPERIASEAGAELAEAFGPALRTVVLYGSTGHPDFRPERSDINLAAVAGPLSFAELQRVAQWYARWRGERVAAPLLLAPADLARSLDVFPLEMLDIQARHRTLAGEELFRNLPIARAAVRLECEREAKGKLLRLRALYLELAGSILDLRALIIDSRKSFLHVMRGLLWVRGLGWETREAAAVAAFARAFDCALPVFEHLAGGRHPGPIEERFADYVAEIEAIATLADAAETPA
ncbi:MAG: hypothetical protein B6D46_00820 [Polyangiaceae bacterium UTPRO1]|jgi:hypothetical protein|nr:hypothetical protein [Myxococcales bacterium]OQY69285.1 MAG: hypothetical protein B6D46_00820 [Polyangiaceae bacterium UTPRO1]